MVDWWAGGLVEWIGGWVGLVGWCGLVDWWSGGVEACSLGLGGLQVNPSTRDRDGSADSNELCHILFIKLILVLLWFQILYKYHPQHRVFLGYDII